MDLNATVNELAPRLLRYCLGRSGHPDLAEDATQDALSALVDRWRRSGPPDSVDAFAFTVARRRLARRQRRRRLTDSLEVLFGAESPRQDPESRAAVRGDLVRLRRGLDRLRPKLREALLLVSAGEASGADAAEILGISPSALKMRVSRARLELRAFLDEPPALSEVHSYAKKEGRL